MKHYDGINEEIELEYILINSIIVITVKMMYE